jgi:carboxymethylenebutenolidase
MPTALSTQKVWFPAGRGSLEGFLARPDAQGAAPGLVVIHEAYGLNDHIRDVARRLAGEGYVALAVDLFAGRNRAVCMARFMAGILLDSLGHGAIHDLKSALSFLAAEPGVDPARLGAIGFCMGGSFAVAWACTDDRLKVVAPFYAMNPRPLDAVSRACPVVGSYPEKDFTAGMGRKLDAALTRFDIPHDIKAYPNAKHSFFNELGASYDPAAAHDAWRRTLAFFKERLG